MAVTTNTCILLLILSLSTNLIDGAHHGGHTSAAPAPAVDCTTVVLSMADCLSYVQNGSTVSKPAATCCSGLKTVLDTNAECLCEAYKNSASFGIVLDQKKAMALPSACKIDSTAAPTCGMSIPGGAPSGMPPMVSAGAPITGASETAPAPAPSNSASSMVSISVGSLFLALVAASLSI